jgi:uncharacterized protein (DUF2267 family)
MRSIEELVERMVELGFRDREGGRHALDATLAAVGEALTEEEAAALAAELPEPLARIVREAGFVGLVDAAELYERARRHARTAGDTARPPGRAREQTQIALHALGEALGPDARGRLVRSMPHEIGQDLWPPEEGAPAPHGAVPGGAPLDTLAAGRPGSKHPVASSRPSQAQSHSVVREKNPHGETKLSSARGLTQERFSESLAEGRPPSPARKIGDAHERGGGR